MGKPITVYLTDEELKKMQELCDKTGDCPSRIVKLAITELHVHADTLKTHRPLSKLFAHEPVIVIEGLTKKPKKESKVKSRDIVDESAKEVADLLVGESKNEHNTK